jgi:hypothetical protein
LEGYRAQGEGRVLMMMPLWVSAAVRGCTEQLN